MRKENDGEKKRKRKKRERKKRMPFLVATKVGASWPPERRLTGMPHARANIEFWAANQEICPKS